MTTGDTQRISLQQLSSRFEEKIRKGSRIRIRPPGQSQWFYGAYRTIQKTLHDRYAPMTEEHKKLCSDLLWRELPVLTVDRFDDAVGDIIKRIAKNFNVSIGHAQKLVSIFSKYAFVVYKLEPSCLPDEWREFVSMNQNKLLVPIDSVVLLKLKGQLRNIAVSGVKTEFVRIIEPDGQKVFWSRIEDFGSYWSLQQQIRAIAKPAIPLEYEMRNLWVA